MLNLGVLSFSLFVVAYPSFGARLADVGATRNRCCPFGEPRAAWRIAASAAAASSRQPTTPPPRRRHAARAAPRAALCPHHLGSPCGFATSRNMSDDHGATRKTDRTSQELDAVRAMVAEMRRDIAALRAELGPDAAPHHVAPWPTPASAYASIPTVPRV